MVEMKQAEINMERLVHLMNDEDGERDCARCPIACTDGGAKCAEHILGWLSEKPRKRKVRVTGTWDIEVEAAGLDASCKVEEIIENTAPHYSRWEWLD